jgi:hypothetical protein
MAATLLGAFPVLAGLGLIETDGGIEPFARVVAILFGGVFLTIGGVLLGNPLLGVARAHGAPTWRAGVRMGLHHLPHRPTLASSAAALGFAPLAVGYWLAISGITVEWLGGMAGLRALVIIEFLVIHGFPFLVIATWFAGNTGGVARVVAGGMLVLLLLLYSAFAWSAANGVGGLVALLYLVLPNILAFTKAESPGSGRLLVTSRWVVKFALFMLTTAVLGGGSFDGPEAIRVGAVYFTLLAGVELLRVVEIPGELAAAV